MIHRAPPNAGMTRLLVTALRGEVVGKPIWSREREKDGEEERVADEEEEERAWEGLGILGLPRDEEEWAAWEEKKADWRRRKATREEDSEVDVVQSPPEKQKAAGRKKKERSKPPTALVEELVAVPAKPARQPKLNSLFSSTKSSVAATAGKPASSKKRPPTSPIPPPPARRSNSSNSLDTGASRRSNAIKPDAASRPGADEAETLAGRSHGRSLGEEEEILFEGGCTQMHLPSPTPHRPPSQQPSQPHLHPLHHPSLSRSLSHAHTPSARPSLSAAPFSSPGLNHPDPLARPPIAASTPFLSRTYANAVANDGQNNNDFEPLSRSISPSRSRSTSPPVDGATAGPAPSRQQTQFSTLATTTNAAETLVLPKEKLHRLSSIAKTESQRSSVCGFGFGAGAAGGGSEDADLSRFLEDDARD
ncbi:hypothetical protein JCM11251_003752 [Rhodosporidiobolus azoricus]